jgi:hypothetical protein
MECVYQPAWLCKCKKEALSGKVVCSEHLQTKCSNKGCSNQAIAECGEASSMACGAPYCSKCGTHIDCWYKRRGK